LKISNQSELYRSLPSIDELLREPPLAALAEKEGMPAVTDAVRQVLAQLRQEIAAERLDENRLQLALAGIAEATERQLFRDLGYSLRSVINATGVILHTNLGRAPLAASALQHIQETAGAYSNLEFDLESGERGKRDAHVERLLQKLLAGQLTGGHADVSTIVVNNNAAAVLLALNTLAEGGEVIVSRGELVEIGGSFRIPEVMKKSGAMLREVGTTNRTRIADYEQAICEKTRLLLRVHRSNFQITGFTEQPSLEELIALGREKNMPVMEDLGSGAFFDLRNVGIGGEPGVLDSLRAGIDVVTYSGDKLLGGPQAGLISGRSELVRRMRSNSLFRALRVDKLTYAALEGTLLAYVRGDHEAIPALRSMRLSKQQIGQRAEALAAAVPSKILQIDIIDGQSLIGGGAAPSSGLPTRLLAITVRDLTANELADRLRRHSPPIIARVEDGRVLLDLRTVFPEQDERLVAALIQIGESRD